MSMDIYFNCGFITFFLTAIQIQLDFYCWLNPNQLDFITHIGLDIVTFYLIERENCSHYQLVPSVLRWQCTGA